MRRTWLACAPAHKACCEGYRSYYLRLPRLFQDLDRGRADGRYAKMMRQLAKTDVLVMDDWHEAVGDATLADAILDRVGHNAYKINLSGSSMHKEREKLTTGRANTLT